MPAGLQFKYACAKILFELMIYMFNRFLYFTVGSQELEQLGLDETVDLHVCEVPVEYQAVQSLLPGLWKEHKPQVLKNSHIFFSHASHEMLLKVQLIFIFFCE